jgi:hypothetical protein
MSTCRQPERFGPHVPAIARFIATGAFEPDQTLSLLEEINCRWPNLSFRDFFGARVLAAAMRMETEGNA